MKSAQKVVWYKVILGSILAVSGIFIAQFCVHKIEELLIFFKIHEYISICLTAILYPVFVFLYLKLFIEKFLKIPLSTLRFKKISLGLIGIIVAFLLPVSVVIYYQFVPGTWIQLNVLLKEKIIIIMKGIFFYCVATAISEEMVFRGVIMGLIEKYANVKIAVLVPSVIFSVVHVLNCRLSFLDFCQLLVAGTAVGVLFSLIAYYYDNLWNNTLVHVFWNASTIGLSHIGTKIYKNSIYNYVLKSNSVLITGGNFGFESSIISIGSYSIFIIILLLIIYKRKSNTNKL